MVEVRIGTVSETLSHEEFEARIRAGRIPRDAQVRMAAITGERFVPAAELPWFTGLATPPLESAAAWIPPVLTALLVGVQIRIWAAAKDERFFAFLAENLMSYAPRTLEDGQIWRPLTMGFLQTEELHLLTNMVWLFYVGWNLERTLGRTNLLLVYVASVLCGSIASTFFSPWVPSLGASGGVFGLVAAVVSFGLVRGDLVGQRLSFAFGAAMAPYLVLTFLSGIANTMVDNWCHLGGLVCGLVLGLLLDPPGHERRPGWNGGVRLAVVTLGVVALGGLWAGGPRLVPLYDSELARWASSRTQREETRALADPYRSLHYAVPAGWRTARDGFGEPAFGNPLVAERRFGASVRTSDRPRAADALADDAVDRLLEDWPSAELDPPVPVELAGRPALLVRGRAGGHTFEARIATRGVHALTVVWECDDARCSRLEPLRDRLLRAVRWDDPEDLVRAREDDAVRSTPATRLALAGALARVGEPAAADALHEELAALAHPPPDLWKSWLSDLVASGADAGALRAVAFRGIGEPPDPKVAAVAAEALASVGDDAVALGILALAWEREPGNRTIARARRARHLSTRLVDGVPWENAFDPVTRAPSPRPPRIGPIDVAGAEAAGRELLAVRARVAEAARAHVEARDPSVVDDLVVLAEGELPTADPRDHELAALEGALAATPPDWLPAGFAADRAWLAELRDARTAP